MGNSSFPGREKRKGPMISAADAEFPRDYHTLAAGGGGRGPRRFTDNNTNGGFLSSSLDRRQNAVAAKSLEALNNIHKADIERQRNAFMDLQKTKYPNSPCSVSAAQGMATGGRQQQPNYWSFKARTPRVTRASPPQPALADQASRVSFASAENLETMSEADVPLGFNRMNRLRQSLPLARSSNQAKLRAPGVLFLQLGEETRRVHLTHELTSLETLRALIVHMFPQRLTMAMLRCPSTALLIKDEMRNVFYELEDPRDVQDRCVIKIYCKEPIYGTYPGHHLANGDLRREMVYAPQDSPSNRRLSNPPMSSQHSVSSASPPQGSPSRARLLYGGGPGGRPSSYAGPQHHPHHTHSLPHPHSHHSSPHHHHQQPLHQPHHAQQPAFCASPSAILERRDVKPDEEVGGGSRSVVLLRGDDRGGGGAIYADPYSLGPDPSRLSMAGGPHSPLPARAGDPYGSLYRRGGGGGGGGGAGSVRSLTSYSAAALQGELMDSGALYRQGGPLYNDAYTASMLAMGLRVPPHSSPQKIPDMRDSYSGTMPGRGSPGRQSLRRDSVTSAVFGDSPKARAQSSGLGLGSEQLCLMAGPGGELGNTGAFGSPLLGNETETRERMEAMEKQIASLTGLLQSVLSRGPDADSPEKIESASDCSGTDTLTPSAPLALMPPPPSGANQTVTVSRPQMQQHLQSLQQNTNALRKQLSQLRNMQLENQDSVLSLLRETESELSLMMLDATRTQEDPLQRQRLLVEEERLKYLNQEELLIQQLHDLERSVEELQRNSSINHGLVTEQDVEQKTKELRMLGETLTELKNQFPSLQSKMRVVLRVEVEAVKFLKDGPHRLDALLKRCNTMTDALASLRRQFTEGVWKGPEDLSASQPAKRTEDLDILNSPPLNLADLSAAAGLANWMPGSCGIDADTSGPEQDIPSSTSFRTRMLDELPSRRPGDKSVSAEVRLAAERDWEEKRASLTQFSAQDINRLLEETQAELMKAIPDLDFAAKHINKPAVPPKPQMAAPMAGGTTPSSPAAGTTTTVGAMPATTTAATTTATAPCGVAGNPGGDQHPGKVQMAAQKLNSLEGTGSRRGSAELTVARYRTEKPSKSPPPPPPRRSFPSAHGLTTNRTGEVIMTTKKAEEDADMPKTLVKLRRTPSDTPRPASTPPVIAASAIKDEDDEERIIAELEIFQRTPVKDSLCHSLPRPTPTPRCAIGSLRRKSASNSPGPVKGPQPTVAARLKHLQQGSLERPKNRKQREDFPKIQGQQQVFHF